MRTVSAPALAPSPKIDRNQLRLTEASFGTVVSDIATLLYPPPNTAAQIAVELKCSVRSVELYMSGKQKWSGDAIALFVSEICHRHKLRNVKIIRRG